MHMLIVGMTMSGKTTLAMNLARESLKRGRHVLVYDKLFSTWPAGCRTTGDAGEFLAWARDQGARNCTLIIDESASAFLGRGQEQKAQLEELRAWATAQSRHWGHNVIVIGQRHKNVPKNVREQCAVVAAFRLSRADARSLADDIGTEFLRCEYLPRFQYFLKNKVDMPAKLCVLGKENAK